MNDRKLETEARPRLVAVEVEPLPLRVVPDWDEQARRAADVPQPAVRQERQRD